MCFPVTTANLMVSPGFVWGTRNCGFFAFVLFLLFLKGAVSWTKVLNNMRHIAWNLSLFYFIFDKLYNIAYFIKISTKKTNYRSQVGIQCKKNQAKSMYVMQQSTYLDGSSRDQAVLSTIRCPTRKFCKF